MSDRTQSIVVGVFSELNQADAAIRDLLRSGFAKEDIGFLVRQNEDIKKMQEAEAAGDAAALRTTTGTLTGGVLGGLIGALIALAFPGVGPVLSAGMLAAAGGAIAGGFTGLMSTMDLSEEEIQWYEGELAAGRSLVLVRAENRYSEALAILQTNGAYDMTRRRDKEATAADIK